MFVPERITVPEVVFVKAMPVPPSIALIVPDCTSYEVPVRTPDVPEMVPPLSVTVPAPTVWPAIARVPFVPVRVLLTVVAACNVHTPVPSEEFTVSL